MNSDLEIIELCAEAMGLDTKIAVPTDSKIAAGVGGRDCYGYNPLHDDAQAMALVKKFHIQLTKTLRTPKDIFGKWIAVKTDRFMSEPTADLNRAICECVAKMQEAK